VCPGGFLVFAVAARPIAGPWVAIDLAGDAAAGSFHSSIGQRLAGKGDGNFLKSRGRRSSRGGRRTDTQSLRPLRQLKGPHASRIHATILPPPGRPSRGRTLESESIWVAGGNTGGPTGTHSRCNPGGERDAPGEMPLGEIATSSDRFSHMNDPGFGGMGDTRAWMEKKEKKKKTQQKKKKKAVGARVPTADHTGPCPRGTVVRGVIQTRRKMGTPDACLMDIGVPKNVGNREKFGRVETRILIKTRDSNSSRFVAQANWARGRRCWPGVCFAECPGTGNCCHRTHAAAFPLEISHGSAPAIARCCWEGLLILHNARLPVRRIDSRRRSDYSRHHEGAPGARAAVRSRGAFLLKAGAVGTLGSVAALPLGRLLRPAGKASILFPPSARRRGEKGVMTGRPFRMQ